MNREKLAHELDSQDAEVRRRAAARLSDDPDLPPELLLRALGDSDWRVRKEATLSVVSLPPTPALMAALVSAFEPGENVGLRNAIVDALAGFGLHAIGPLASSLGRLDADGRKLVVDTLARGGRPEALTVLKTLIRDADANVRAAAIEAIAAIGESCAEDAIALLDGCLDSGDRFERLTALEGLNRLGAILPWERLQSLLDDPLLTSPALVAAGRSAAEPAVPLVLRELERSRGRTWDDALGALVSLARSSPAARARIEREIERAAPASKRRVIDLAASTEAPVESRRQALAAVGLLRSDEAARVAVEALADDSVAAEAETALLELGSLAVGALVDGAGAPSPEQRAACIELLGPLTRLDPDASDAVRGAIEDPSPEVVAAALAALAEAGDTRSFAHAAALCAPDVTPLVRQAAQRALTVLASKMLAQAREFAAKADSASVEAEAAVLIIEALGPPVRGSIAADVEFLSTALARGHPSLRRVALSALAAIGGALTLEPIVFALTDEESDVRLSAVRALGRLRGDDGSPLARARLLELAESTSDPALAAAAARALGDIGDPGALPVLRQLVHSDPMIAVAAVEALAGIADPGKIDALVEASNHADTEVVKAALRRLALEPSARVIAHLGACLDHATWDVRRLAAELLGKIGGEQGLELLRGRLAGESEPLVKEAIANAIAGAEAASGRRMTAPPPSLGGRPRR